MNPIEEMKNGKVYKGFHAYYYGKDYFFISVMKNKTASLCCQILKILGHDLSGTNQLLISDILRPANCEIRKTASGRYFYNIWGKNFGGYGSDNIEDGKTVIIELEK